MIQIYFHFPGWDKCYLFQGKKKRLKRDILQVTQRDRTNDVTFCPRENQGQDFVQNYFRRSRNWALTTDVSAPSMAGLNAGFVCFILKAIGYSILTLRSTGRHKKTGTFEKPNKN